MKVDEIKELTQYLRSCVEPWVEHELLTMNFSEQEIWAAIHHGFLIPREEYHFYDIKIF